MLKFNEQELFISLKHALLLREQINSIIDMMCKSSFKNVVFLGIGGTYASSMQATFYMKCRTNIEVFAEQASTYLTVGNKRITKDSIIIISSVSGTTTEVVKCVEELKKIGCKILGFIDKKGSPLHNMIEHTICYPLNEQLKFFMVADRILYLNNELSNYYEKYEQLDRVFASNIINIEKKADNFAKSFALEHSNDMIHYFVGSGIAWGMVYSYAMCYWEEQHWLRARPIESSEFFHGTLEIIDRFTPVTVYISEDSQRSLSLRVANFIPKISEKYTIIDSKNYDFPGIDDKYRDFISLFILQAINRRIDAYIEKINRHPMEIRRYYRNLEY